MAARIAQLFIPVLAFALPLAGLFLALAREAQGERPEALRLGACALAGTVFWVLILTT